jgi:hypothetical protein
VRRAILSRVTAAQGFGRTIRQIVDAIESPRPANALARHQLAAIRQRVVALVRDLDARDHAGLDAPDIAEVAARTFRALHGVGESPTHKAARMAMSLDATAALAVHGPAAAPPWMRDDADAFSIVVRSLGVANAALSHFALNYPELAIRLDRASLDRLVIAWTGQVQGGRWPALAAMWRERFAVHLSADSIKVETTKLRKSIDLHRPGQG